MGGVWAPNADEVDAAQERGVASAGAASRLLRGVESPSRS